MLGTKKPGLGGNRSPGHPSRYDDHINSTFDTPSQGSFHPPTDQDGLAQAFARRHSARWRYVPSWRKWLKCDGTRWRPDDLNEALHLVQLLCREAAQATGNRSPRLTSAPFMKGVLELAEVQPEIAAPADAWDRDPWVINTPGGVIDLKTGAMRTRSPGDLVTKVAAVTPS